MLFRFSNILWIAVPSMLLLCIFLCVFSVAEARQPNIVLIFADDLGWKDVGYQGTDFYETPNIDRLARSGMVFTHAYATGGNCVPSRACLMSGLYTPRHEAYAVQSTNRGPKAKMRVVPVPDKPYLENRFVSVAAALKANGYTTGIFGKWHLEDSRIRGTSPKDHGFDVVFHGGGGPPPNSGGKGVFEDPKSVNTLTREACTFIEANRDKPFFVFLSHYAIHTPHQTTQATLDKFKNKTPGKQHNDPHYAGVLYDMDKSVQVLLDKIDALGLADNTVVVLTSDNGGIQQSSQEPLRGSKGCYYEGGIREPFIVRWTGVVKPGSVSDVPTVNLDLYPTFLDIAQGKVPEGVTLDGESLVPILKGTGSLQRQSVFWHFPGYLDVPVNRGRDNDFRTRPTSVIRKGDWKLHLFHEEWVLDGGRAKIDTNNCVELYNTKDDIGERINLATTNKQKRDELLDDLLAWFKETQAKLPTPLPSTN